MSVSTLLLQVREAIELPGSESLNPLYKAGQWTSLSRDLLPDTWKMPIVDQLDNSQNVWVIATKKWRVQEIPAPFKTVSQSWRAFLAYLSLQPRPSHCWRLNGKELEAGKCDIFAQLERIVHDIGQCDCQRCVQYSTSVPQRFSYGHVANPVRTFIFQIKMHEITHSIHNMFLKSATGNPTHINHDLKLLAQLSSQHSRVSLQVGDKIFCSLLARASFIDIYVKRMFPDEKPIVPVLSCPTSFFSK